MKTIHENFKILNSLFTSISKKHEVVYIDDGLLPYRFCELNLASKTTKSIGKPLGKTYMLDDFGKREMPSLSDYRDALLISESIFAQGINRLFELIELYMDITSKAPLALGFDTNVVLNGITNVIREKIKKSLWKGSIVIVIPTIVYQEVNRLFLEEYPSHIPKSKKDLYWLAGLPRKMGRIAILGLGNIRKLREEVQVVMTGEPISPNVFLSSTAGKYFNDFMVREQIREYARKTGIPTLHLSADRDSITMARAEGTPSVLIELPPIPKNEIHVNIADFVYTLAILRGVLEIRSSDSKKILEIKTIWHGKKEADYFNHIIEVSLEKMSHKSIKEP